MRLILGCLFTFAFSYAHADQSAESMVRVYSDGETSVVSPKVDLSTYILDDVQIGAGYAMDIVTSASTDVRSWASKGVISDNRREIHGDSTVTLEKGSLSFGYVHSEENDYESNSFAMSTARDFFEKNTTVEVGLTVGEDHIKSSADPNINRLMNHFSTGLGLTQVLNRVSLMQILYDFRLENGYLASPYRVARVTSSDGGVLGMPENHPLSRDRHALAFRYNRYLSSIKSSSATTLRLYMDNWGVKSGTIEERLSRDFSRELAVSLTLRYYYQTNADFYKDKYDPTDMGVFFTGNKTLAQFSTTLVGVRPTYKIGGEWSVFVKGEYYLFNYGNFTDVGVPGNPDDDRIYELSALNFGAGIQGKF